MQRVSHPSGVAAVGASALFLLTAVPFAHAQPEYELIDLGTLGGASAQAYGINQNGVVAGEAQISSSAARAALWDANGVIMELGVPPEFTVGEARAVNGSIQVAGVGSRDPQALGAFLWEDGVWTELPVLPGRSEAIAEDINSAAQIVGSSFTLGQGDGRAVLWESGIATDLGTLADQGGVTSAFAINDAGQIVGRSVTNPDGPFFDRRTRAFIWEDGVMSDLGVLSGEDESGALAVNASGEVAGESWHLTSPQFFQASQATLWRGSDEITDLGLTPAGLPGPCSSDFPFWTSNTARAVNNCGQVVGSARCVASGGSRAAFLWQDGVNYNLNDLIVAGPELNLLSARGINDAGQIVGIAVNANERLRAFRLDPLTPPPCGVPEDLNDDGVVDVFDLLMLLAAWGPNPGDPADINGDGVIDVLDLLALLAAWS